MFSWYKCLIVSLVFSHLGFWSGSLFLIAPFPDLCLLVLFYVIKLSSHLVFCRQMAGVEVPVGWRGGMNVTYRFGDSFKTQGW